jgi:hypothetical protein
MQHLGWLLLLTLMHLRYQSTVMRFVNSSRAVLAGRAYKDFLVVLSPFSSFETFGSFLPSEFSACTLTRNFESN